MNEQVITLGKLWSPRAQPWWGSSWRRPKYVSGAAFSGLRHWGIYPSTPIHYWVRVVIGAVTWLLNRAPLERGHRQSRVTAERWACIERQVSGHGPGAGHCESATESIMLPSNLYSLGTLRLLLGTGQTLPDYWWTRIHALLQLRLLTK